jgi:hypothetical protein
MEAEAGRQGSKTGTYGSPSRNFGGGERTPLRKSSKWRTYFCKSEKD